MELSKETQALAVAGVIAERKAIIKLFKGRNYFERFYNANSEDLYGLSPKKAAELKKRYRRKYTLSKAFETIESTSVPLIKKTLYDEEGNSYEVEFGDIILYNLIARRSEMLICFHNNGLVELRKTHTKKQTPTHPVKNNYDASFNVLSNDFKIIIDSDELDNTSDHIEILLNGNILTLGLNNVSIDRNLETKERVVRISDGETFKTVSYDSFEEGSQIEKRLIGFIKSLVADLPVPGLIARTNRCLELINKKARENNFFNPGIRECTNNENAETLFTEEELSRSREEMFEAAEGMNREYQKLLKASSQAAKDFIARKS